MGGGKVLPFELRALEVCLEFACKSLEQEVCLHSICCLVIDVLFTLP